MNKLFPGGLLLPSPDMNDFVPPLPSSFSGSLWRSYSALWSSPAPLGASSHSLLSFSETWVRSAGDGAQAAHSLQPQAHRGSGRERRRVPCFVLHPFPGDCSYLVCSLIAAEQ